ncbi:hypothetical protein chiPu_0029557, partial [Chiloscyllium punctatum]|nr:hypothetical protein [Chiloscyllium punctatum]
LWSRLQSVHQNGSWCADLSDSRREQEAALADFKADVSEALGYTPVDWNAIVAVTQKPGEGAQEYEARKFEAFQAHSGIPDADRQNPAFIQIYKDGLGPKHQAVLQTGLVPYVSFTELENWAMSPDNQAPATVAALSTPGPLVCFAADRRVTTSLTARSPSDAPETPTQVSTGAVPHHDMPTDGAPHTPANKELPSREPTATQGRKNPTNPAALARSLPPPTGISSVTDSCSSSYSYSPGVRTE